MRKTATARAIGYGALATLAVAQPVGAQDAARSDVPEGSGLIRWDAGKVDGRGIKNYPPDSPESVNETPWAAYEAALKNGEPSVSERGATNAAAMVDFHGCPESHGCFYSEKYFKGVMGKVQGNNQDWAVFPRPECFWGNWKDCASSAGNRRSSDSFKLNDNIYTYPGSHLGDSLEIPAGLFAEELVKGGFNFDNRASSNEWR